MPLANVLSALRILILDHDTVPPNFTARRDYLQQRLPQLTNSELADLIKIPADKLAIYTRSIFAGEGQLLQRKLPATWELLREIWPSCFGEAANHMAVARKLHQFKPWDSRKTESLIEHYAQFIEKCIMPDCGELAPLLLDTLQFELATFWLYRSSESLASNRNDFTPASLAALTVEELLRTTCSFSKNVSFLELHYRFVPGSANLSQRVTEQKFRQQQPQWVVGARAPDQRVTWLELTRPLFKELRSLHSCGKAQIAEIAEAFLADGREFDSETAQFKAFMQFFAELRATGFITELQNAGVSADTITSIN
jgi:hypothetical protein